MTHQETEKPHYSAEIKQDQRQSLVDAKRSGKPSVTRGRDQLDSVFMHTGEGVSRARANSITIKEEKETENGEYKCTNTTTVENC